MSLAHTARTRCMLVVTMVTMVVALAGCRSARHAAVTNQPQQPDTTIVPPTLPDVPSQPRQLSVISFTAIVEGTSVSGQVRIAHDSLIWLSVTKIIELGRAMATPDSVWVTVPIANKRFAGNYHDVERHSKQPVNFAMLQEIATADDAEERIEAMARTMGLTAKVRITKRQQVQRLTFPFQKQ